MHQLATLHPYLPTRPCFEADQAEEDEIFAAAVWQQMVALALAELEEEKVQGGSRKG
jgi:hypothetical protein